MERQSRTWLCSVVFLDIVGYTAKAVTQQIDMKQHLQELVGEAIATVPENERIFVDTGDGMALCFLGDPEEALFVALNLRDRLNSMEAVGTPYTVRIGINLGPVKVVKSLSGQQNPLGDGINNAQRVMSFANPRQILVSRSFYDVIACLSQEYSQLFQYMGVRKDKHDKEHTVYEVRLPDQQEATYATAKALTQRVDQQTEDELLALTWDTSLLQGAERELAPYVGPLAKVLVGRAARQASNAGELYEALGAMIPDAAERERFLGRAPAGGGLKPAVSLSPPKPAPAPERDSGPTIPPSWDPVVLKAVEQCLALHLGPLAKVLVRRAAQKTSEREELYRLLANELASSEEKDAFLKAVRKGTATG
jgi:class 3 adenylate cyclase